MQKQGIRQIRLSDAKAVRERMSQFVGKNINLVFHNNKSITGLVTSVNDRGLVLMNMRKKKMSFAFADVAEVYLDVIV